MDKAQIINRLNQSRAIIHSFGVARLQLFGSVARVEAGESSDVDFLVTFKDSPTFDQYMDLKLYLEDLLGHKIDLVTADAVREPIKVAIEQDAIDVA